MKISDLKNTQPVKDLKTALLKHKSNLPKHKDGLWDAIDKIMKKVAAQHNISPDQLHDLWVDKFGEIPDKWIKKPQLSENASGGATASGNIASSPHAFSAISRRPNLFGWIPEEVDEDDSSQNFKWKVYYKRPGYKDILAGDAFIVDAPTEQAARKMVIKLIKAPGRLDIAGSRIVSVIKLN